MSDILNHYHCAREVYNNLTNEEIKKIIENNYDAFRLGSQGPDFFYYNILDTANRELSYKIGRLIHTMRINDFFYYGVKFANSHPKFREVTLAYLLGFITHHALDSLTHPFIYHRTGTNSNEKSQRARSTRLHKLYEVLLDTALSQYEYSKQAVNENPEKVFSISSKTRKFLEKFYRYILMELYHIDLPKKEIRNSLKTAVFFVSLFKDPNGWKANLMNKFEKLVDDDMLVTRFFYPMYTNEFDILNINNKEWKHPVTGEVFNKTYPELFHEAVDVASENINNLYQLANSDQSDLEDYDSIFHNLSYFTGKDIKEDQALKYIDENYKNYLQENY